VGSARTAEFPGAPGRGRAGGVGRHAGERPRDLKVAARRAVALYLSTLMISVLIAGTAISLVGLQRTSGRIQTNTAAWEQSEWLARAGLEYVLWVSRSDKSWRSVFDPGSAEKIDVSGLGKIEVTLTDPADGNLADDERQRIGIQVSATSGGVTQTLQAFADPAPHAALGFALFSTGSIDLGQSVSIAGPVRAHTNIGAGTPLTVLDGASFETLAGATIAAALTPATYSSRSISAPAPNPVFYSSRATTLSLSGSRLDLFNANLTETANTLGTPNAQGIYAIYAGSKDVRIENVHLRGTLIIVTASGQKVEFTNPIWFEPGPLGYPTLLINNGSGVVAFTVPADGLQESDAGIDFNQDGDQKDVFDSAVSGLVWTNGSVVELGDVGMKFTGCVVGSDITVNQGVQLDDDADLAAKLLPGFTDGKAHLVRGSVREVAP